METYYAGWHRPNHWELFEHVFMSVTRVIGRKSPARFKNGILDCGGFTLLNTCRCGHGLEHKHLRTSGPCGKCRCKGFRAKGHLPVRTYALYIDRVAEWGNLQAAVSQDYMCEEVVLLNTGMTVREHQQRTLDNYIELKKWVRFGTYIMPVLQGYEPQEYVEHIAMYGELLERGAWVCAGSMCKRNGSPEEAKAVLRAIKAVRPDLRLHGLGLKYTACMDAEIRHMLHSSDSQAASYGARRNGGDANDPQIAIDYAKRMQALMEAA